MTIGLLPFFHLFGLLVLFTSIMGMKIVVMKKFKPQDFLASIDTYKINTLFLVPSMVLFLAKTPLLENYNISCLANIFCGAAPLSPEIEEIIEKR